MSSLSTLFILVFWSCAGLIAYTYAIYAPLVWCLSRWMVRQPAAHEMTDDDAPMIWLLIVAHNEEAVMEQRLRNAPVVDYPRERIEIAVAETRLRHLRVSQKTRRPWFVSGCPDPRWNDDEINTLKRVQGSDFEVVQMKQIITKSSTTQ